MPNLVLAKFAYCLPKRLADGDLVRIQLSLRTFSDELPCKGAATKAADLSKPGAASVAAAVQMTVFFSPVLRGWLYSIFLGVLVIVFAAGADMFRGSE